MVCDLVVRDEPDDNTAKLAVILNEFSFSVDLIVLVGDDTFEIANSSCRIMVQNCLFEDIECVALIAREPSPETFGRKIDVPHWTLRFSSSMRRMDARSRKLLRAQMFRL